MSLSQARSEAQPLRIVIVGAGIGGLTAGLSLRQQGHDVTILETSKFSNETGAAIHIAPNCNGLLRRMGVYLEEVGANLMNGFQMYTAHNGQKINFADLSERNKGWQHPWFLIHRAHLHTKIKEHAISKDGKGKPCELKLASKVVSVDAEKGEVKLESGEVVQGDVILGADGVHSVCRKAIVGEEKHKPFDCGHSAFRFLVPIKELTDDPITAPLLGPDGFLTICLSNDRRIVYYPCVNNTIMNFLLIHPSGESRVEGADWNQRGDKKQMLEIARVFPDNFKALLSKAPEETLKVWTLLDMDVLDTWTTGHLALLGDAAHPFQPHQAQGGAQAIEDAISVSALLPLGTTRADIPDRLQLYVKCRKARADHIQEFTRISGMSPAEQAKRGINFDPANFNVYNFSHDEWDSSRHVLNKHLASKAPYRFRQPLSFGPSPGPRQPTNLLQGVADHSAEHQFVHSIRFATSATLLKTLFPSDKFSFTAPITIAQASIVCCSLRNLAWLGGTGYNHCGLYIHGVQYTKADGSKVHGTFLPILFENLTDPIITGREELGAPKWGAEIDITGGEDDAAGDRQITLAWRGKRFGMLDFPALSTEVAAQPGPPKPMPDNGILTYRYVPAVGEPGKADAEYAVFDAYPGAGVAGKDGTVVNGGETASAPPSAPAQVPAARAEDSAAQVLRSDKASIKWDARDWKDLPTIHHIVSVLAELPVYRVLDAKVERVKGIYDVSGARRIE